MTSGNDPRRVRYEAFDRAVNPWMLGLSIAFLPVFLVAMMPAIPQTWRFVAESVSWGMWSVFLVEFLVRLLLAPRRLHMVRTHLFDLLVLALPFLRALRGLRVLRSLARAAFAVGGITVSGRMLESARRMAKNKGVPYVLGLVALAAVAGAIIVQNVESDSPERNIGTFGDAIWWAASTVTTVGYGDRFPTTTEGRLVAFGLMLLGLGLFSLVTARIAAFFVGDADEDTDSRAALEEMKERLSRIEAMLEESRIVPRSTREGGSNPSS
jgi:voltage-gated potassium channel